jgi:DNA-binding NarL/FixJ family response regulator
MIDSEITILIADDHPIFQRGLQQIIESDKRLKIVAAARDGEEALTSLRLLKPKVAVLDVDMPRQDGFAVSEAVKRENLPTQIVILTMHNEERFFNAALDAGVKGYVLKDSAVNEINTAIHLAAVGKSFVSPGLSDHLVSRFNRLEKSEGNPLDRLTVSERRVFKLVAESKSNKQIAEELFISIRTVEHHRTNICSKLGLSGKNALLTYALTNKADI